MKLAIQITSAWCVDAYVATVRPPSFTDQPRRARTFPTAAAARAYAAQLPARIAAFAPPTTYRLVRLP